MMANKGLCARVTSANESEFQANMFMRSLSLSPFLPSFFFYLDIHQLWQTVKMNVCFNTTQQFTDLENRYDLYDFRDHFLSLF